MNRTNSDMVQRSGGVKCKTLTLGLMTSVSEALAGLVQGMLGPCGQQTLLSTHTGQALVTRDGLTVVCSLHLAHPVARCITQSLRAYHSLHRDGSKTFILYLAQVLKAIGHRLELESSDAQRRLCRIKLCAKLNQFLSTDFEQIAKLLLERVKSCSMIGGRRDFLSKAKDVLKTSLCTCLQKHSVTFFTNFLGAFLDIESQRLPDLEKCLSHILQHFDMYHSKVSTQPQQKSRICPGILLETDLQSVCQTQTGAISAKSKRFVLMDIDLDGDEEQTGGNAISIQPSQERLTDFFSYKRNSLKRVLTGLSRAGVDILLCADSVPQYVAGMCREEGLALRCLRTEKLTFLRDLTGVAVLKDLNQEALTEFVFTAHVNSFVHMGSKVCTLIRLSDKCCTVSPAKHMVVCAPTEGLCDQLCHSLFKALKAIHLCLRPYDWGTAGVTTQLNSNKTCARGENHNNRAASVSDFISLTDNVTSQEDNASFNGGISPDGVCDTSGVGRRLSSAHKACREDSGCTPQSSTPCFSCSMLAVSSGGTFEAALITTITDYYASQNCRPEERVDALVQKMLMAVPEALHANLSPVRNGEQRRFTEKWTSMLAMTREGRLVGLGLHGDVCDATQSGHLEPVASKLSLVGHVLQLVVQLLRVDALVPVRKLPDVGASGELGDDEQLV